MILRVPLLHTQKMIPIKNMEERQHQSSNTDHLDWSIEAGKRESGAEMNKKGDRLF